MKACVKESAAKMGERRRGTCWKMENSNEAASKLELCVCFSLGNQKIMESLKFSVVKLFLHQIGTVEP